MNDYQRFRPKGYHDQVNHYEGALPHYRFLRCEQGCAVVRQSRWSRYIRARGSRWWKVSPVINIEDLPPVPACYAIYIAGKLVYVGSSMNIQQRFTPHLLAAKLVGAKLAVKYKLSTRYGDWRMTELRLINRLRPALNVRRAG